MSEDRENLEQDEVEAHVKHGHGGHEATPSDDADAVEAHVKHGHGGHEATQSDDDDSVEAHVKMK